MKRSGEVLCVDLGLHKSYSAKQKIIKVIKIVSKFLEKAIKELSNTMLSVVS